jgi:hypothetical protein
LFLAVLVLPLFEILHDDDDDIGMPALAAAVTPIMNYNPGLTSGTGLGNPSPVMRVWAPKVARPLSRVVSFFQPAFWIGTPERAGEVLAELAAGNVSPPAGRVYTSLVKGTLTFPDPSALARSDEARDRLWRESAIMVGLPVESTSVRCNVGNVCTSRGNHAGD